MFHYIESITVYIQSIIVIARVTTARVSLCINASRALKLRGRVEAFLTRYYVPFFIRGTKGERERFVEED